MAWVDRLGTILQGHGASVGILMSSRRLNPRGNGRRALEQIRILSVMTPPRVVLPVSRDDIHECTRGTNFLHLISTLYVQAKTGADKLRLLGS